MPVAAPPPAAPVPAPQAEEVLSILQLPTCISGWHELREAPPKGAYRIVNAHPVKGHELLVFSDGINIAILQYPEVKHWVCEDQPDSSSDRHI